MGKAGKSSSGSVSLGPDFTGFWVTCDRGREKQMTDEMNALGSLTSEPFSDNIDDLNFELKALRGGKNCTKLGSPQLGKDVQCIRMFQVPDPLNWTNRIFENFIPNGEFYFRAAQRIIPIERACQAHLNDIITSAKELIKQHFPRSGTPFTFAIIFESRMNSSLDRKIVTHALAEIVSNFYKVDLKNPKKVFMVQVLKNVCTMSVLENYYERKRCNVQEFATSILREQ